MNDVSNGDALRLQHFAVERLFDEFDYDVPLNPVGRITALIAPNGSGKTACLRLRNWCGPRYPRAGFEQGVSIAYLFI